MTNSPYIITNSNLIAMSKQKSFHPNQVVQNINSIERAQEMSGQGINLNRVQIDNAPMLTIPTHAMRNMDQPQFHQGNNDENRVRKGVSPNKFYLKNNIVQ